MTTISAWHISRVSGDLRSSCMVEKTVEARCITRNFSERCSISHAHLPTAPYSQIRSRTCVQFGRSRLHIIRQVSTTTICNDHIISLNFFIEHQHTQMPLTQYFLSSSSSSPLSSRLISYQHTPRSQITFLHTSSDFPEHLTTEEVPGRTHCLTPLKQRERE